MSETAVMVLLPPFSMSHSWVRNFHVESSFSFFSRGDMTPGVLREGWLFYKVLLGNSLAHMHIHTLL